MGSTSHERAGAPPIRACVRGGPSGPLGSEWVSGRSIQHLGVDLLTFCSEIKTADTANYFFYDMSAGTSSAVYLNRGGDTRDVYMEEWFFPST
jgi:hypothetical protein